MNFPMPYVQRDETGNIISLSDKRDNDSSEFLPLNHPEILVFLHKGDISDPGRFALSFSDNELVRVIEDLVDLLIRKQIILYTELPNPAQQKLLLRTKLRENIHSLENLIVEEQDIL